MKPVYPVTDFSGVLLVQSLEIGAVGMGAQRIPTVRFLLRQSGLNYSLLAIGRQSGEVYAYALAAIKRKWAGLEVHITAYPRPANTGRLVFVVSYGEYESNITWHSGSELRTDAAQILVDVLNGTAPSQAWPVIEEPFVLFDKDG